MLHDSLKKLGRLAARCQGSTPSKNRSSPRNIGYRTAPFSPHRYQRQNRPKLVFIFWSWNKQLYVPNTSHLTAHVILQTAMVFQEGDLTRLSSPLLGGSGSAPLLLPQHPALLHCPQPPASVVPPTPPSLSAACPTAAVRAECATAEQFQAEAALLGAWRGAA